MSDLEIAIQFDAVVVDLLTEDEKYFVLLDRSGQVEKYQISASMHESLRDMKQQRIHFHGDLVGRAYLHGWDQAS